jgi:hypothetical protein
MTLRSHFAVAIGRPAPAVLLAASLLALVSCEPGGGGSKPPIPYEEIQGNLESAYGNLEAGIQGGSMDQVPSLCNALSAELDRVEEQTKGLGILEREKIRLQLSTARHNIDSIARTAPVSGDVDLLKAQLQPVDEAVHEITGLLGQLAAASKSAQ